ncbi:uncharacterized protein MICPUCDRAFT_64908 [Micromonas pusilla CCMP1545]|uniref:Predicted protein n=1 Tax=Micromonas pusilla (strain CCMP1545) TaxID=564608 RepID=C1ML94_MICPC|nr:uncharacterized protein MICPUCDRAFT_64908 [Micromonas pusilla CCMP1545]EEH59895.1 predicted protein [Micromonas pusilla CCMP1545]|eukprot:XP_003056519.1 predicted protein [Micromonas pusilla CCMP1545]
MKHARSESACSIKVRVTTEDAVPKNARDWSKFHSRRLEASPDGRKRFALPPK